MAMIVSSSWKYAEAYKQFSKRICLIMRDSSLLSIIFSQTIIFSLYKNGKPHLEIGVETTSRIWQISNISLYQN